MDPPWVYIKGRGRGRTAPSRGNYGSYGTRSSQGSSYISDSNAQIIPTEKKMVLNKRTASQEESSSSSQQLVSLEDIPKDSPLYAHMQAYLEGKKQKDTFVSIIKEDSDDIKSYEKLQKREMIFLLENSDLQRKDEPWKIFQRYLVNGLYFPGESYKTRSYYEEILMSTGSVEFQHFSTGNNPNEKSYNFSKFIIKQIISAEDWGMSTMKERQISLGNTRMNYTYWDYIRAFDVGLHYNNDKHKHTWFVKVCAKIFADTIPNWSINWWSYHGPTTQILPEPFLTLYKEWTKVSPDLNRLYHEDHVCWIEIIDQIYFFIEFSIPWIHKWTPEVGFSGEENIPCLYRTYYNNFWDKLLKIDPKTKQLVGQELIDSIKERIEEYKKIHPKKIIEDNSVRHIARRISFQEGDKEKMIQDYLEEVRKNLLLTITQIDKSDTSMQSETSNDVDDSQRAESEHMLSATELQEAEDFLQQMKALEKGKNVKET
ncbi:hypothetical protein R3W88_024363 [Solanum pinnatisectum]|uniref:Uncharacterized protein n=1 Tax=Solanum pinnatisectum TaxID=50273 RepID=A0AAV9M3D5_9SOLN|nr:hypothetical protein R3W88_024363 [Solanum pinnatisectum]